MLATATQRAGAALRRVVRGPVILISLDGGRRDLIYDKTIAPHIDSLRDVGGAYASQTATCINPSITLVNHTSMLTGRLAEGGDGVHGITWNSFTPERPTDSLHTVIDEAHAHGLATAVAHTKPKLRHLFHADTVTHGKATEFDSDAQAVRAVETLMHSAKSAADLPDAVFIHLSGADVAGHRHGWGSTAQRATITQLDGLVGRLVHSFGSSMHESVHGVPFAVIVTADHGGGEERAHQHSSGHGLDVQIPWVLHVGAVGESMLTPGTDTLALRQRVGDTLAGAARGGITQVDTAPTMLGLLGINRAVFERRAAERAVQPAVADADVPAGHYPPTIAGVNLLAGGAADAAALVQSARSPRRGLQAAVARQMGVRAGLMACFA
jgi:hypothetical protein